MEGKSAPAAATAIFSAVLDDDDLLGEILVRVAFPTSLVRAALVCKRWLRLASAPAFLRHFRDLHPPSLLGFYVITKAYTPVNNQPPRFVPVPQPPELAAVVRRASFDLDSSGSDCFDLDYWNGLLLIFYGLGHPGTMVRCPLYPATYTTILPPVPNTSIRDGFTYFYHTVYPNGDGDGELGMSYICLAIGSNEQQSVWDVYVLQGDVWDVYSSAVTEIKITGPPLNTLISHDKVYNLALVSGIYMLVSLDLASSCLSLVNLPEELKCMSMDLSLANDSGVHLIYVKGSQLNIWHYMVDKKGLANWLPVDTICLREICVNHMISTRMFEDVVGGSALMVQACGVNSGFLFLEKDCVIYLFDIKRKEAKKVYEVTQEDTYIYGVTPFMMVWPPKFPVMKEGCDPKE